LRRCQVLCPDLADDGKPTTRWTWSRRTGLGAPSGPC
jgi:hypothetical protein